MRKKQLETVEGILQVSWVKRGGFKGFNGKKIMHLNDSTGFKGKEWDFMGNSKMWFDDV